VHELVPVLVGTGVAWLEFRCRASPGDDFGGGAEGLVGLVVPEVVAAGFGVNGVAGILGVIMAEVDHYWIAEQLVGESVQGAGTMSGREVAKAQVHATLALVETLRGISAELVVIRQAAQIMSAGTPPTA
jgi:hypothetical protein